MSLIFVLFIIVGNLASLATSRTLHEATVADKHEQWMATFGRKYENEAEKEKRFKIFQQNLEYIESFNNGGNRTYKLGINQFADLTQEEFLAAHTGYKIPVNPTTSFSTSFRYENVSEAAPSLDWRHKGAVTPIKNQKTCGSCWAFSAVAAMEGIIQISTGQLKSFSEQQLLDCTSGNNDCRGGRMMDAFEYVIRNNGITSEENYPYQEMEGACDTTKAAAIVANIKKYEMVPENDEQALLKAVMNQPVSVAIDGYGPNFQNYQSGVFTGDCSTSLNHAVTIVGYGTEEGLDYWLVKNSWGTTWGESGYMKIQRNYASPEGLCGIAKLPSYPTV